MLKLRRVQTNTQNTEFDDSTITIEASCLFFSDDNVKLRSDRDLIAKIVSLLLNTFRNNKTTTLTTTKLLYPSTTKLPFLNNKHVAPEQQSCEQQHNWKTCIFHINNKIATIFTTHHVFQCSQRAQFLLQKRDFPFSCHPPLTPMNPVFTHPST